MTSNHFSTDSHGWAELLAPRPAHPALKDDRSADWVVVGAGVTGLACAKRLAEQNPSTEIILLEAREIAQGATARSSGFVMENSRFGGPVSNLDFGNCQRVNRINSAGLSLLRDTVMANEIACDWREKGLYHVAADIQSKAEYLHYVAYLRQLEIEHTELSETELTHLLGTAHYSRGLHVAKGVLVQPARLARGLADHLPDNVTLFENTPVLNIRQGKIHELQLPHAKIHAANICLATNYEITRHDFLKNRITGIILSGSFTRQLSDEEMSQLGILRDWGTLSLHDTGATVRLTADRRICIRNCAEFRFSRLLSDQDLSARVNQHRAGFEQRFPQLAHIPFEFTWSGVEGISVNSTNFFGNLAARLWFSGGYNGSGLSKGTAFGTAMADYALGNITDLVRDCLESETAKWMPPEPFRSFGGNLTLRRNAKNAGADK